MKIRSWPDPILRRKAFPVDPADPENRVLAEKMLEIMGENRGIGLAANQVGVPRRLLVIGRIPEVLDEPLVMLNPEIVSARGRIVDEEGCLSFPGNLSAPVRRFRELTAAYRDLDGQAMRIEASGLLARVIQHETDHLNGITFPDRLPFMVRRCFLRRYARGKESPERARALPSRNRAR